MYVLCIKSFKCKKTIPFDLQLKTNLVQDSKTDQPEKKSPSPVEWAYFVKPVRLSMDLHMWDEQDPASSDQCLNLLHLFVKVQYFALT